MTTRKASKASKPVTVTVHAPIGTRTLTVTEYWVSYWRALGYVVEIH